MDRSALSSRQILQDVEQKLLAADLPGISFRYIQDFFSRNQAALTAQLRPALAQRVAGDERGWLFAGREELIHALKAVMAASDKGNINNGVDGVGFRAGAHLGQVELRAKNGNIAARVEAAGWRGGGVGIAARDDVHAEVSVKLL